VCLLHLLLFFLFLLLLVLLFLLIIYRCSVKPYLSFSHKKVFTLNNTFIHPYIHPYTHHFNSIKITYHSAVSHGVSKSRLEGKHAHWQERACQSLYLAKGCDDLIV
jgi:hypothetical protein